MPHCSKAEPQIPSCFTWERDWPARSASKSSRESGPASPGARLPRRSVSQSDPRPTGEAEARSRTSTRLALRRCCRAWARLSMPVSFFGGTRPSPISPASTDGVPVPRPATATSLTGSRPCSRTLPRPSECRSVPYKVQRAGIRTLIQLSSPERDADRLAGESGASHRPGEPGGDAPHDLSDLAQAVGLVRCRRPALGRACSVRHLHPSPPDPRYPSGPRCRLSGGASLTGRRTAMRRVGVNDPEYVGACHFSGRRVACR